MWKWRSTCPANPVMSPEEIKRELPVRKPSQEALANPPANKMQVTWLGHASVLTQWDKWNVLCDPIFSERCSPTQLIGPRRLQAPPLLAHELPPIDVICISHNHFDHLDLHSVRECRKNKKKHARTPRTRARTPRTRARAHTQLHTHIHTRGGCRVRGGRKSGGKGERDGEGERKCVRDRCSSEEDKMTGSMRYKRQKRALT